LAELQDEIAKEKLQKDYILKCKKDMQSIPIVFNPIEFREIYHP
jgi:hypothetical protein